MLTFPSCESCREELDYSAETGGLFNTEPTSDLNVPLLMQTLLAIHAQPELWHQGTFFGRTTECGTTRCFAGWTLTLSGYDHRYSGSYAHGAQGLLGLTDDEREHLFFHLQTDDLAELTAAVHAVLAHRGLLATKELTDVCNLV